MKPTSCRGLEGRNVYLSVPQDYGAFRGQWLVDLQREQRRPLSLVDELAGASVLQNRCQLYL